MIVKLNNKDRVRAERILETQTAAYKIEAEIIKFYEISALNDTVETIINSNEIYLGYEINSTVAGFLSYEYKGNFFEICKMTVDPDFFRNGVAGSLLRYMMADIVKNSKVVVSTGSKNVPAKNLYRKYGFEEKNEIEIEKGFFITLMEYSSL